MNFPLPDRTIRYLRLGFHGRLFININDGQTREAMTRLENPCSYRTADERRELFVSLVRICSILYYPDNYGLFRRIKPVHVLCVNGSKG